MQIRRFDTFLRRVKGEDRFRSVLRQGERERTGGNGRCQWRYAGDSVDVAAHRVTPVKGWHDGWGGYP